jgi:FecR protein
MRQKNKIGYLIIFPILTAGTLMAQSPDPPSRVARLNYLNGQVSFRPASVDDWVAASLNYPLTTGDHLWTDPQAQTEMHVGSTAIRMGSETALAFLNLDDRTVQLSLTDGSLNVHIRSMRPDEVFEVDTPNASVTLRPGDYRIDVDSNNNVSSVIAHAGEADIAGSGGNFPVYARQMAHVAGNGTLSQEITPVPPPDAFDGWCRDREHREESMVSARYVPRDMIGYEDLDAYGVWRNVPPYGWVWAPTSVPPGWAPYRSGHWAWVDPWGWTWIADEPWGFAVFHYGRWAFAGGWVWVPGRLDPAVRPVYAPALVAFVGGPRFGVAVGVGGVGMAAWFPLGPGEVYRPAYQVSAVYVRQMNIVQVTDVTVIDRNVVNVHYVNQGVPGAVVAVPHDAFVGARPVAAVAVRVDVREVAAAPVIGATAAIAPRRESVLAGPIRPSAPPARVVEHQVVMKSAPPPPPVSFAAKQHALEANGGRPLDAATVNTLRTPAARNANVPPVHNDRPVVRNEEERRPPAPEARSETSTAKAAEERKSEPSKNEKKPNKKATKK